MKILGFIKTSTLDYPSKVVSCIFIGLCNLDCLYCHNRELIKAEGLESIMSIEKLIELLKARKGLIDGLCISGGEPSLHGRGLIDLIKKIKRELGSDFLIKLDTNGTRPKVLQEALYYIDYVALDYKTYNYKENLGIEKNSILESIEILKKSDKDYEVRLTMYPRYIPLYSIDSIIGELEGVKKVYIQQYLPVSLGGKECYTIEDLEEVRDKFLENGIDCQLRV